MLSCAERTPLKSTCCHALQCNTVLSCITMPARCDGITKQSRFTIPMTMLLSTSATRFCYAVTAALPIMCCLATAQHAVKRERSTVLRHHQLVFISCLASRSTLIPTCSAILATPWLLCDTRNTTLSCVVMRYSQHYPFSCAVAILAGTVLISDTRNTTPLFM